MNEQRTPDQEAIDNPCAATLRAAFDAVKQQRDEAIAMLADWCVRVDKQGTDWDSWDEAYKNAASRPCGIRELLDIAIHNEGINYVR
jgi:hypothetical protein